MFSYLMLGTNHLPTAIAFYDPLMEILGHPRGGSNDEGASWGTFSDNHSVGLCVGRPFNAPDTHTIDRLYAVAVANGGTSEGAPGFRPQYGEGFYSAYVRDPDGNKLAFVYYAKTSD